MVFVAGGLWSGLLSLSLQNPWGIALVLCSRLLLILLHMIGLLFPSPVQVISDLLAY